MHTHADQQQGNRSQAVANGFPMQQAEGKATLPFEDNRPEAIRQRKLQEAADNSPQVKQLAQLQAMVNSNSERRVLTPSVTGGVVQLKYTAAGKKKSELVSLMAKWKDEIQKDYKDTGIDGIDATITALTEYCDNHDQAVLFLNKLTYKDWSAAEQKPVAAADLYNSLIAVKASADDDDDDDAGDPLALAKRAISRAGHRLSRFTDTDIQNVHDLYQADNAGGWAPIVQKVWEGMEQERINRQRQADIAVMIPIIDALLPPAFASDTICAAIWASSKSSAGANGYYELPDAYNAGQLQAAWTAWGLFRRAVDRAGLANFSTHRMAENVAQDKSGRDDIRTRKYTHQMNFSITWAGAEQMHHVGLEGTRNPLCP